MVDTGDVAPEFELETPGGRVRLADFAGEKLVLAFYTEDATPTCSAQVTALKSDHDLFAELGARVIAVSADSLSSHRAFVERLGGLPFELASDPGLEAARAYGVVDDSGRRSRRAIFVIEDGVIRLALPWFNPSNSAQYQQVFEALGLEV
jgi:peroxiredoxin